MEKKDSYNWRRMVFRRVLIENLLREGMKVTWIDNLRYWQQSLLQFAANPDFTFQYRDVRDVHLMREIIPNHDVFLPLAAIVGAPACELYPDNYRGCHDSA